MKSRRLTYSPPKPQTHLQPAVHCSLLCWREMCLHLKFSKDFICSKCVAPIYSFCVRTNGVSANGCLDVLQPLPPGHLLFLKHLGQPALGVKRNREMSIPPPQRCSAQGAREKQPTWWDRSVLRHHQAIKGLRVRKAAWASQRARRAGEKEPETA